MSFCGQPYLSLKSAKYANWHSRYGGDRRCIVNWFAFQDSALSDRSKNVYSTYVAWEVLNFVMAYWSILLHLQLLICPRLIGRFLLQFRC